MLSNPAQTAQQGKAAFEGRDFNRAADLFRQAAGEYQSAADDLMAAEMKNNLSVALLQAGTASVDAAGRARATPPAGTGPAAHPAENVSDGSLTRDTALWVCGNQALPPGGWITRRWTSVSSTPKACSWRATAICNA